MKFLDKLISFIFAIAILALAVTVVLVTTGYVSADRVYSILHEYVFSASASEKALIVACVVILAVLKVTILNSSIKSKDKGPILVETNHGMIEISQDTIENTVRSVASEFPEIKEVQAKMIKQSKGIKIYADVSVLANTNIRQLTGDLQERIEEVIDETIGIKILSTNIKIKNIYDRSKKNSKVEYAKATKPVTHVEHKNVQKEVPVEKAEAVETKEEVKEEIKEEVKEVDTNDTPVEEVKEEVVE